MYIQSTSVFAALQKWERSSPGINLPVLHHPSYVARQDLRLALLPLLHHDHSSSSSSSPDNSSIPVDVFGRLTCS